MEYYQLDNQSNNMAVSNDLLRFFRELKEAISYLSLFFEHIVHAKIRLSNAIASLEENDQDKYVLKEIYVVLEDIIEKNTTSQVYDLDYVFSTISKLLDFFSSDKYKTISNINRKEISETLQKLSEMKSLAENIDKMNKEEE